MDDVAIGGTLRSIRIRLGRRQIDVADAAGVSQQQLSLLECGGLEHLSVAATRRLVGALGAELVLTVRWRGAELDRLRDEDHALVVAAIVTLLASRGWLTATEVTYSHFGERGSIDVLAYHPPTRMLLVIEVKTDLVSVEATLRGLDAKARLAPRIARERFGWATAGVARLLVVEDSRTGRRRVERHDAVLRRALPVRGWGARSWLAAPGRAEGLLLFLTPTRLTGGRRGSATVRRVRCGRPRVTSTTAPPPGA